MITMECANVRRLVGEGLNIERNSPTCLVVRTHLETCAECREYIASMEKAIDCYKHYEVPKPDDLEAKLQNVLDAFASGK